MIALLYGLSFPFFLVGLLIMFVYSGAVVGLSVAAASMANSLELFATVRSTAQVYLSFFSTQFYPANILPPAVAAVSAFNPMTWAVQAFRSSGRYGQLFLLRSAQRALAGSHCGRVRPLYRRTMNY